MLWPLIKPYIVTFIPIFLAVDIIGTIPVYLGLTENLSAKQRHKILTDSFVTATILAVLFIFLGKLLLRGMGITIDDFRVAGGVLLFLLSIYLLLPGKSREFTGEFLAEDIGVFPLATPLITGPAVLVTTLMLLDNFGLLVTLTSLVSNMFVAWCILKFSGGLVRFIGPSGIKAFSKISYIFLAAIAVMIVRVGIENIVYTSRLNG